MKNYSLYKRTVDILYDAYFNDTLQHGNCFACAVGNIVAGYNGIKYKSVGNDKVWIGCSNTQSGVLKTATAHVMGVLRTEKIPKHIMRTIDNTGYTPIELNKIEYAFEHLAEFSESVDGDMYNGLVAVLEVLKEIHEIKEDTETLRFTKHYQTKCTL